MALADTKSLFKTVFCDGEIKNKAEQRSAFSLKG
jgi:hypothetical protein